MKKLQELPTCREAHDEGRYVLCRIPSHFVITWFWVGTDGSEFQVQVPLRGYFYPRLQVHYSVNMLKLNNSNS